MQATTDPSPLIIVIMLSDFPLFSFVYPTSKTGTNITILAYYKLARRRTPDLPVILLKAGH